jgi:leucyl/phenylalanyl-tRNA--protein transferase
MRACAAPRGEEKGTWISEDMIAAYCELHRHGYAHSVEVWMASGSFKLQTASKTSWRHANGTENLSSTAVNARGSQLPVGDELELAGGLYGVAIGRMFYGESMFSRDTDASKIALAHLAKQLERWNFGLIDCQMHTPHLASLGAREIPRTEFIAHLQELINCEPMTDFEFDTDLFRK